MQYQQLQNGINPIVNSSNYILNPSIMNKYILLFGILFTSISCNAQITDIELTENIKLDRVYLGLVSNTGANTTDFEMNNTVSLQSGIMLTYSLNQKVKLRSFGVLKFESNEQTKGFTSYEMIYDISDNINWHFGTVSTPSTELRPNPTTWESQSETNAQSKIIGGRTGTKINFRLNPIFKISYGLFNHNGTLANHLKFEYKFIKIAGFTESNKTFLILAIDTKRINSTLTIEPNHQFSKSIFINFNRDLSLLLESEYSMIKEKINYGNIALRKYFSSSNKRLKGFLSIGYSPIGNNQITGSIAIHT
tara:strand:- start:1187 stop:2107 length:921 start_codon:yes stop_codon:yes gene_type:complete